MFSLFHLVEVTNTRLKTMCLWFELKEIHLFDEKILVGCFITCNANKGHLCYMSIFVHFFMDIKMHVSTQNYTSWLLFFKKIIFAYNLNNIINSNNSGGH